MRLGRLNNLHGCVGVVCAVAYSGVGKWCAVMWVSGVGVRWCGDSGVHWCGAVVYIGPRHR